MSDLIEFYDGSAVICSCRSAMVPPVGSLINIRKETWRVARVTFCVDYADSAPERTMRANVDLERSALAAGERP